MNFFYTHKSFLLIAFMLFSINLMADPVLNKPLNFSAELLSQGENPKIRLSWDRNSQGDTPDYFYLYMADKNTTDPNEFDLEEEIELDGNKVSYTIVIDDLDESSYSFYMTSFAEIDDEEYESERTDILHIDIQTDYFIELNQIPQINLEIGEEWEYEFIYESNADDQDILFAYLGTLPSGMTLDSDKGELAWTPADSGVYEIVIYAYLEENTEVADTVVMRIKVHSKSTNSVLHLANIPKQTAEMGEEFEYKVKAETNADDDDIRFSLLQYPAGMSIDEEDGEIKWEPDSTGFYVVIVEAHLINNPEIADSVTFELEVKDGVVEDAELEIEIEEENIAYIGEEYKIDIKVESNLNCPVVFELDGAPEGMMIDSTNNIIWTPSEAGVVKFWVYAHLECDTKAKDKERVTINVKDGGNELPCMTVSGQVFDENDSLVLTGKVKAYRIDKNANAGAYKPSYLTDIVNGAFSFELPEGKYTFRVTKEGYKTQWFNKAKSISEAEIIETVCDSNLTLNFVLEKENAVQEFVVTGNVYRQSDNTGIKAEVKFIPIDWIFDTDKDKPGNAKFEVETDINGAYTVTLNSNFEYIAKAEAKDDDMYQEQYYDQTADPLEAKIISVDSTNSSVDFYLMEAEGFSNSISGIVRDDENNPIESNITAYMLGDNDNKIGEFVKNTDTDANGVFEFSDLKPGKYILFSLPFDKDYVPGYYDENGSTIKQWKEAAEIELEETTSANSIVIIHDQISGVNGIAEIKGVISKTPGGIIKKGNKVNSTEAIQGAFLYVKDGENIIEYTFSEETGDFEFDKLYQGEFQLVADKICFESYTEQISVDYTEALSQDLSVETNPSSILEISSSRDMLNIFPNPSSQLFTVDLQGIKQVISIKIYDELGLNVKTIDIVDYVSNSKVEIDISTLPVGNYIIQIITNNSITNSKFNVVR